MLLVPAAADRGIALFPFARSSTNFQVRERRVALERRADPPSPFMPWHGAQAPAKVCAPRSARSPLAETQARTRRVDRPHPGDHQRVLDAAELGALAWNVPTCRREN